MATLLTMVTFVSAPPHAACVEARACAMAPNIVYVDTHTLADAALRTRNHELGHIFDYNYMDDGARNRFRTIMRESRTWRSVTAESPHERFAEAFTLCVRSVRFPRSNGGAYGYAPTVRQHRAICGMIQRQFSKARSK